MSDDKPDIMIKLQAKRSCKRTGGRWNDPPKNWSENYPPKEEVQKRRGKRYSTNRGDNNG